MKKEAESNPMAPGGWADQAYYSVPAILRRRGRIVFWVVFVLTVALFTLSAAGQSDSVLHLYLKRNAGADPVHVSMERALISNYSCLCTRHGHLHRHTLAWDNNTAGKGKA
jgi:hypothetical protein